MEIPLLLTADISTQSSADTNLTLDAWMAGARSKDEQLGIERNRIPYAAVYIPDTPQSPDFFNLAKAIGEVAQPETAPENHNQACWLKTMHYYWQAKGVVLAHKLFGVIPDPLDPGGIFQRYLPTTSVQNLRLETEIELACYRLLCEGEPQIRAWAAAKGLSYPFNTPLDLLLEVLKDQFQILVLLGPLSLDYQPLDKRTQRSHLSERIKLLTDKDWDEPDPIQISPTSPKRKKHLPPQKQRQRYEVTRGEYLKTLMQIGWYGYWLLALLKPKDQAALKPLFQAYLAALRAGKDLFIPDLDWVGGQAYKAKQTSRTSRVEAEIDKDGYIRWHWA